MTHTPDRGRLAVLFDQLCDKSSEQREEFFVREALPPTLEQELRSLLACDNDADSFLENPASNWGEMLLVDDATAAPDNVPGCEMIRLLGEGGMGRVWEAQQVKPIKRRVAVKVVKNDRLRDRTELYQRFRAERQTLAQMNHPNIAQIYGGGQTENAEPYLLMEYVEEGTPLLEYCQTERLDLSERLELFFQVCRGVKHAHQKGIIHRDLKPANILVKILDKKPVVKIIDFGIAAKTLHLPDNGDQPRVAGFLAGTPMYMAPEQADVENLDIDTQTDVYALSVVLYQLICNHAPFSETEKPGADFSAVRAYIANKRAVPLRERVRKLSPSALRECCTNLKLRRAALRRLSFSDMDAVLLKGLAADRRERYESVAALMEDLRAFCEHRPVSAVSSTTLYTAGRFVRRNRNLLGVAALVFISLCLGLVSAGVSLVRLTRSQEMVLSESRKNEQIRHFLGDIFKAAAPDTEGKVDVLTMLQNAGRLWSHPLYVPDENPEVRAEMHLALGRAYRSLNQFNLAENHLQRAVTLLHEAGGEQSPGYLQALFEHSVLLSATGNHEDALNLFRKITAWNKLNLGDHHHQTIIAQIHLGGCYLQMDRLDKAERLLQRSLDQAKEHISPHHPIVGHCQRSLALAWIKGEQFHQAEQLLLTLQKEEKLRLPENHPDLMMNLHLLSLAVGRKPHAATENLLVRSLVNPRWYALPSNRDDRLADLLENGDTAFRRNELAKAEKIYSHAYQVGLDLLGREHLTTQRAAAGLSHVLSSQGKHSETLAIARDHEKIARMQFGHSHPITLTLRDNLSRALLAQGKQGEWDRIMQEVVFADDRPQQPRFSELRESNEIVKLYIAQNRGEQAYNLARKNLDRCRRILPPRGGPELVPFLETLAEIQFLRNQRYEAEQYLGEAVALANRYNEHEPHLLKALQVKFPSRLLPTEGAAPNEATQLPSSTRQLSIAKSRVRQTESGGESDLADEEAEMVTH